VVDEDRNGRVVEISGERIWIDTGNNNRTWRLKRNLRVLR